MEMRARLARRIVACATALVVALPAACTEAVDLGRDGYELGVTDLSPTSVRIDARFGPAVTPVGASMLSMCRSARAAVERGYAYFAVRDTEGGVGSLVLDLYHEPPEGWHVLRADTDMEVLPVNRETREHTVLHAESFAAACESLEMPASGLRIDASPAPQVDSPNVAHLRGAPFLACPEVEVILSISSLPATAGEPARLCIVGRGGAVLADEVGTLGTRVRFAQRVAHTVPLDVDGDGVLEFVNRGGGWSAVSVLEHDGSLRWRFPADDADEAGGASAADELAAGDLDGDGSMEFVVGMNGSGGVYVLDAGGNVTAHWDAANVFSVELVDTDGDGALEILHTDGGPTSRIVVRDARGVERGSLDPGYSSFQLFTTPDGEHRLAHIAKGEVLLADLQGRVVARHPVSASGHNDVDVVWVRLDAKGGLYTAVARTIGASAGHSEFYVFDPEGALVHHEELPTAYTALGVLPDGDDGRQALLVGSGTDVRRFDIGP